VSQYLTISSKGQITLKKATLAHMGVQPGQRVAVEPKPGGAVEIRPAPTGKWSDVFGCLPPPSVSLTIEDINDVIARGWTGEFEDNG